MKGVKKHTRYWKTILCNADKVLASRIYKERYNNCKIFQQFKKTSECHQLNEN